MPQAAATPVSGRRLMHRTSRCGQRSFAAFNRWVDDALQHRVDGYRLLDSSLLGLPGVQRLAGQRLRRCTRDSGAPKAGDGARLRDPNPAAGRGSRNVRIPSSGAGGISPEFG